MNDVSVVEWLESEQGESWSRTLHGHCNGYGVSKREMFDVKEDGCLGHCSNPVRFLEGKGECLIPGTQFVFRTDNYWLDKKVEQLVEETIDYGGNISLEVHSFIKSLDLDIRYV